MNKSITKLVINSNYAEDFVENKNRKCYSVYNDKWKRENIMNNGMELHQAIYQFYRTQIQFGFYGSGDKLPALEETCRQFHTSMDTVKPAYHRLKHEGYISLTQKAGAKVIIKYEPEEIEQNIQAFYAKRREPLIDFVDSMWPLLGQIMCYVFKKENQEPDSCEPPGGTGNYPTLYSMWKFLDRRYEVLGNEIFMRLIRYLYLYFYGAFCGVIDDRQLYEITSGQIEAAAALCSEGRWNELSDVLHVIQVGLSNALHRFYEERITTPPDSHPAEESLEAEYAFRWDAYKKSSQLRYSLAMELLTEIGQGKYSVGSYLPSAERLSRERGVSVSTARRTVVLLNSIGAVKSSRPLGARVLPPSQSAENCDFTNPDLRRRLLDLAESLQVFALSAKAVSELTLASLDDASLCQWRHYLYDLKRRGLCERVGYASLSLISAHAPYQTLCTVYSELLRLLFWGYPLERMIRTKEEADLFFTPFFDCMLTALEEKDNLSFSSALEQILLHELHCVVSTLLQLGISEAGKIQIPDLS